MKEFPGSYPCFADENISHRCIAELIASRDFEQVYKHILGITAWLNQGKVTVSIAELEGWIKSLPRELVNTPEIKFTLGWLLAGQGHFSKAAAAMDDVFSMWQDRWQSEPSDLVRQWLFYVKSAQGILYDHMGAVHKAQNCFALAESYLPAIPAATHPLLLDIDPEEEERLSTIDPTGLSTLLIHALRVFQLTERTGDVARTAHNLGCQYLELGEADKAKFWLERALDLRHSMDGQLPMMFSLHSLGQCYHQLGLLDEAKKHLDQCLALSKQFGSVLHQSYALSGLADIYRDGTQFSDALNLYNKSLEVQKSIHDNSGVAHTLLGKATLYMRQGEYALALSCVREAQAYAHGSLRLRLLTDMYCQIVDLLLRNNTDPYTLGSALARLDKLGLKREVIIGYWYLAYSQLIENEADKARATLLQALRLAQSFSQTYSLSHELVVCLPLTKLAFKEGVCPEVLASLINYASSATLTQLLEHVPASRAVVAAAGRLKEAGMVDIELLGEFRVKRGGSIVELSSTRSQKAVLLLKYLAANKGALVAREQIIEAVWPESNFTSAEHSFEVAISTLRKILDWPAGPSVIMRRGRGYQLNPELLIRTDVELFSHHLKQGYWWLQRGQNELARSAWEQADAIYKGDFMHEDIYVEWACTQRESLKERYLDVVLALGEIALERGELDQAVERASFVINHDHLRESAYRLLMKAHFHQGNRAMALRDYQRCQQALMVELGEEPMPETQELLKAIRSNNLK